MQTREQQQIRAELGHQISQKVAEIRKEQPKLSFAKARQVAKARHPALFERTAALENDSGEEEQTPKQTVKASYTEPEIAAMVAEQKK